MRVWRGARGPARGCPIRQPEVQREGLGAAPLPTPGTGPGTTAPEALRVRVWRSRAAEHPGPALRHPPLPRARPGPQALQGIEDRPRAEARPRAPVLVRMWHALPTPPSLASVRVPDASPPSGAQAPEGARVARGGEAATAGRLRRHRAHPGAAPRGARPPLHLLRAPADGETAHRLPASGWARRLVHPPLQQRLAPGAETEAPPS